MHVGPTSPFVGEVADGIGSDHVLQRLLEERKRRLVIDACNARWDGQQVLQLAWNMYYAQSAASITSGYAGTPSARALPQSYTDASTFPWSPFNAMFCCISSSIGCWSVIWTAFSGLHPTATASL